MPPSTETIKLAIFECLGPSPMDALDVTLRLFDNYDIHYPGSDVFKMMVEMADIDKNIESKPSIYATIGNRMFWR
jgi:hypothetical protein